MPLHNKPVALVTGGSRGIGYGIAAALAARGMSLVINGQRPEDEARPALDALAPAQTLYVQADVGDVASHAALLDAVRERFGRLDALVNNAGVAPEVRADVLDATPESFDRLMRINLRGPYFLTQAVARWMIEQGSSLEAYRPSIVNVSSISAVVASVNRGDYCISKAGVAMATQLWATRLGGHRIAVYEVRPGIIHTDMTAPVAERYDQLFAEALTLDPRWGEPSDVGSAVAALVTGALPYSTGNVIHVDGGLTVRRL